MGLFTKSGKRTGWPIIGYIVGSGTDPFIIGLYVSDEKPKSVDDFMRPLCQEQLRERVVLKL